MNLNEEQGFLSDKFEDWSGEPIPNGWNDIETQLGHKGRGKRFFWIFFPAVFLTAAFAYLGSRPDPAGLVSNKEPISPLSLSSPTSRPNNGIDVPSGQLEKVGQSLEKVLVEEKDTRNQTAPTSLDRSEKLSIRSTNEGTTLARKTQNRSSDPSSMLVASSRIRTRHSKLSTTRGKGSENQKPSDVRIASAAAQSTAVQRIRTRHSTRSLLASPSFNAENGSFSDLASTASQQNSHVGVQFPERNEISFLEGRLSALSLAPDFLGRPTEVPVTVIPAGILPEKKVSPGAYFYSFGMQAGMATNEIELRHSETQYQLKLRNPNSIQSGFVSFNGRFHYKALSWLETYASVQAGVFRQVLDFDNKTRTPDAYNVSYADNKNSYQAVPVWQIRHERLGQTLVFTNTEIGVRPQLFGSASGPFAGLVVWTRLFQSSRSSLGQGSSFGNSAASIGFGYRAGYRLSINNLWFLEGSVAGMPNDLLPQTPGLRVLPTLYGLSLNRRF